MDSKGVAKPTSPDSVPPTMASLLQSYRVINKGSADELECWGYKASSLRWAVYNLLAVLSFGTVLLVVHWKPELRCYLAMKGCSLHQATVLVLKSQYGFVSVVEVKTLGDSSEGPTLGDGFSYHASTGPYSKERCESLGDLRDDRSLLAKSGNSEDCGGHRYFDHQEVRYIWNQSVSNFTKLEDLSSGVTCYTLHERYKGLSDQHRQARLSLYGPNIMEIKVPSYWNLLIEEVLNPFYIFQIASVTLWCLEDYYYYAGCIFFISALSIGISLRETKRQMETLRDMVATADTAITVCIGNHEFVEKPEHLLVPGDVISIPPNGCVMSCDAVLTAGTCIVNESMLTGESIPVTKTPLLQQEDEEIYSPEEHKRHTLFSGTHIVQTRYYGQTKVLAVVVRTGFSTAKGELVRAILFPKPLDFKFYQDAIRFIMFLSVVASLGMVYSLAVYIKNSEPVWKTIRNALDIITIIVPPALPAAMTVGTVYAQNRLKKANIFCISPPRINFCGRIDVFCFDKTGTLTEDGLDMWGVVPVAENRFGHHVDDPSTLARGPLLKCLASCHSLTIINGELNGDPLDLIMFNSIKWYLEEPGTETHKFDTIMPTVVKPYSPDTFLEDKQPYEVGIIRQFTFSSSSQRMSVITRTLGDDHMEVYTKGAPEKIASLCLPETVPENFTHVLHEYSIQGFRVIALAYRVMEAKITWHQVHRVSRDKVEKDLTFLGLLIMQNQLKPQTTPVIQTLKVACIRSVMITGDMLQTAISVARNCGMVGRLDRVVLVNASPPEKGRDAQIHWEEAERPAVVTSDEDSTGSEGMVEKSSTVDMTTLTIVERTHLAISGKSFSVITQHFPDLMPKICVQGTVFARMSPDQKCQLIEELQQLDYMVGMCGDGANDCEALKAAHAGISLSEAEASVAAPFTSQVNNIQCVVTAVREGRAALVTSFSSFKYMALYSFIQFITVVILYTYLTNLSDFEFLYIDLVITTTIAILMGNTAAYDRLVCKKPPGSLLKPSNLVSIVVQVTLVFLFQLAGLLYLRDQDFFVEAGSDNNTVTDAGSRVETWESTVLFLLSSFMYISVAYTFSQGPPFRQPIYTNVLYLLALIVLLALSVFFLLKPLDSLQTFFEMKPLNETPFRFRLLTLILALSFICFSMILEWIVVESGWLKSVYQAMKRAAKTQPAQHKAVSKAIGLSDWPPVGQVTTPSTSDGPFDAVINVQQDNT